MYNHIGMQLHGRELTLYAQFYRYTGDKKGLILKHFDKIMGRAYMLLARRRAAQQLPKTAQDYGMLRGDANEDLGALLLCGLEWAMRRLSHAFNAGMYGEKLRQPVASRSD